MQAQRKIGRRCAQVLLLVGVVVAGDVLARSWMASRSFDFSLQQGGAGSSTVVDLPAGSWGHSSPQLTELADGEVLQLQTPTDMPQAGQFFPHDVQYFPTAFQAGAERTETTPSQAASVGPVRDVNPPASSDSPASADSTEGWVQVHGQPVDSAAALALQAANGGGPVISLPMPVPPMPAPPIPEPARSSSGPEAVLAIDDSEGRARVPAVVPDPLEPPQNAAPIHDSRQLEAVRSIVRQELPNASPEEVDIWVRELGALPAGAIRDLLGMRRKLAYEDALQIPPLTANLSSDLSDEVDVEIDPEKLPPSASELAPRDSSSFLPGTPYPAGPRPGIWSEPTMGSAGMLGDGMAGDGAVFAGLRQQALQNLLNVETVGYKSIRPRTMPLASREPVADPTPAILFEVDMAQGRLEHTGRALDVAIDGPGFFVVRSPNGISYTRCGQFVINERRQLVLAGQHLDYVLQLDREEQPGDVTIGDCAPDELQITRDGEVFCRTDAQAASRRLGRIQLVAFDNPSFLMPVGICFEATTESGSPRPSAAERVRVGRIVQGALEDSNVDVDREQARIARWAQLQAVMQPRQVVPYTAPPAVFLDPPPGGAVAY